MNTFEEFKENILHQMNEMLSRTDIGGRFALHEVEKSGVGKLTGIVLQNKDFPVVPCLYINQAYEQYKEYQLDPISVVNTMFDSYIENMVNGPDLGRSGGVINLQESALNIPELLDNLRLKAVPVTGNESYLADIPHIVQGDIAAICQVDMGKKEDSTMCLTVNNQLFEKIGMDKDSLFQRAEQQTVGKHTHHIMTISDVLVMSMALAQNDPDSTFESELKDLPAAGEFPEGQPPMLVVTVEEAVKGANLLFCHEVMDQLAEKYPDGFHIIPSSIHEFMVSPKSSDALLLQEMNEMVKSVNEEAVSAVDKLSDIVHEYDPKAKQLYIAGQEAPSLKQEKQKEQEKKPAAKSK